MRIYFTDFWNGFNPEKHNIGLAIRQVFPNAEYISEPIDVDVCVFSVFGNNHTDIDARCKISYQGEPGDSYFDSADLAVGFDFSTNPKIFRCPIWKLGLYENHNYDIGLIRKFTKKRPIQLYNYTNTIPIGAMYSNPSGLRYEVIPLLVQNGLCASYGRFCRSHIPTIDEKEAIVKEHPFHLSFENGKREGYVSEKLKDALLGDSIPFYWGDSRGANDDFNPNAFFDLSCFNMGDGEKACAMIYNIINRPNICQDMQSAPVFKTLPEMDTLFDAIRNVVTGYDI